MADLKTFESLFDDPILEPPPGPPPFRHERVILEGALPDGFSGKTAAELAMTLADLDLEGARELVEFGSLWLDGHVTFDPGRILKPGRFRLNLPSFKPRVFYEINPSRIVYSDGDLIVYDKESGRPSHGVPRDGRNNVLAAMERHTGLTLRLAHRLDAPTSGLLMLAATSHAANRLGLGFKTRTIRKRYLALSRGQPPSWRETLVDAPIGKVGSRYALVESGQGLDSRTKLTFLASDGDSLLFMAEPLTGRTHQIRLHMAELGYPVSGDAFYGGQNDRRLMLRASGLALNHPVSARPLIFGGPWEEADLEGRRSP